MSVFEEAGVYQLVYNSYMPRKVGVHIDLRVTFPQCVHACCMCMV